MLGRHGPPYAGWACEDGRCDFCPIRVWPSGWLLKSPGARTKMTPAITRKSAAKPGGPSAVQTRKAVAMRNPVSRRDVIASTGKTLAAAAACVVGGTAAATRAQTPRGSAEPFRYCFNTATIMGQNLPLDKEAEIAGRGLENAVSFGRKMALTGACPWGVILP